MSLTVQTILDENLLGTAHLIAGKTGLAAEITWVNVMEILDAPESVEKGELLITTGYQLDCENLHAGLISQLKEKGVSGMAVQLGYYIREIPEYIRLQADKEGFPVLTIPSHKTFSEILHILIQRIHGQKEISGASPDQSALLEAFKEDIREHSDLFFTDKTITLLLMIRPTQDTLSTGAALMPHIQKLRSFLTSETLVCTFHGSDQDTYLLMAVPNDTPYTSLLYTLNIELTLLSERMGIHFYVGADQLPNMESLTLIVSHLQECTELLASMGARRGLCYHQNIPFLKMLDTLHHNQRSVVLDNQPLQLLLNYDKINETNYTQTLRLYFAENCNVTRTAKRLYIHRHTLLNRLDKIRELSNLNLEDYYARIYMSIALLFHDYFAF